MPPDKFFVRLQGTCPMCGGAFSAGYVNQVPAVTHTLPPCPTFIGLEADEYLHAVRTALVGAKN